MFIDCTVQMALFEMPSTGKYRKPSSAGPTCIAIPGVWMPETETVAAGEGAPEDVFDEEKARRDATNNFALAWRNWQKLAASIDWRQQDCSKNAAVWATVDVEAVIKNDLGIPQYRLSSSYNSTSCPSTSSSSRARPLRCSSTGTCRTLPSLNPKP